MAEALQYAQTLRTFIASGAGFAAVYRAVGRISRPDHCPPPRVLVLDSSFNPPHVAHLEILTQALHYNFEARTPGKRDPALAPQEVLLLLSVRNADKAEVAPDALAHRVAMMRLLADSVAQTHAVNATVGLTHHARFAEKAEAIHATHTEPTTLTFLAGFDTLVRIFDPKYYVPLGVEASLRTFMRHAELFVLTRSDGTITVDQQHAYLKALGAGLLEGVPPEWYFRCHLTNGSPAARGISSSAIRKAIETNEPWKHQVPKLIAAYISAHGLYTPE